MHSKFFSAYRSTSIIGVLLSLCMDCRRGSLKLHSYGRPSASSSYDVTRTLVVLCFQAGAGLAGLDLLLGHGRWKETPSCRWSMFHSSGVMLQRRRPYLEEDHPMALCIRRFPAQMVAHTIRGLRQMTCAFPLRQHAGRHCRT